MIGKIVQVSYIIKVPIVISNKSKESLQLHNTSMQIQKFLMDAAWNPGAAADPNTLYSISRNETNKSIEDIESGEIRMKKIYIQYGQNESIKEVKDIEANPLFIQWIEDYIIDEFKSFKVDI